MKYWNKQGQFEAEAAQLQTLVPGSGNCATHKGEVWRAAAKIYYDYFNNGFGNTWCAAAEFLMDNVKLPKSVESVLLAHANGNMAQDSDYNDIMDVMIDTVIVALRAVEDRPNTVDMWEYSSPRYRSFAGNDWDVEDQDEDDYCYN